MLWSVVGLMDSVHARRSRGPIVALALRDIVARDNNVVVLAKSIASADTVGR